MEVEVVSGTGRVSTDLVGEMMVCACTCDSDSVCEP